MLLIPVPRCRWIPDGLSSVRPDMRLKASFASPVEIGRPNWDDHPTEVVTLTPGLPLSRGDGLPYEIDLIEVVHVDDLDASRAGFRYGGWMLAWPVEENALRRYAQSAGEPQLEVRDDLGEGAERVQCGQDAG